jgi:hypothetical protein
MRTALIVGINYYEHGSKLFGCVNDAHAVKSVLERDDGGAVNFDCNLLTSTGPTDIVTRDDLKDNIEKYCITLFLWAWTHRNYWRIYTCE